MHTCVLSIQKWIRPFRIFDWSFFLPLTGTFFIIRDMTEIHSHGKLFFGFDLFYFQCGLSIVRLFCCPYSLTISCHVLAWAWYRFIDRGRNRARVNRKSAIFHRSFCFDFFQLEVPTLPQPPHWKKPPRASFLWLH